MYENSIGNHFVAMFDIYTFMRNIFLRFRFIGKKKFQVPKDQPTARLKIKIAIHSWIPECDIVLPKLNLTYEILLKNFRNSTNFYKIKVHHPTKEIR